jgi:prepilin-type N-terminal cleavage/methylation domain-containing protein
MKKFTLIELLIVIAIIGILTSILLPSIQKAREKSHIAVEISNRKQLYVATVVYSDENNGYLPVRGSYAEYLHLLDSTPNNLNETLVNPYIGAGEKLRTEIMFCDSTLMSARNPNSFQYDVRYCTLSYYQIPDNGNLVTPYFDNSSFSVATPSNALWSCMTIFKPAGSIWLGHNSPVSQKESDGASTVFVDGSGKWVRESSYELLWIGNQSSQYYQPMQ